MIDESDFLKELPMFHEHDVVYVHQCFMSLFSGMLDWVATKLYPRINYKVITTYDKAVEVFKKKQQNADGQVQTAFLPALTLDPMLDFSNEERAGRFYWMFRNLSQPHGSIMWNKINLVDQGVSIVPMFTRYQGTVELTGWFPSIYELIDYRTRLIQYCGGYQRWIRPELFWTHLILPDEILTSEGPEGTINWDAVNPKIITLETTTEKVHALPFRLDAIWRLDSCGDGTNKMGADQIAEYKVTSTFTWECNIPTFIRIENYKYPIHKINLGISLAPCQCRYPMNVNYMTYFKLTEGQKLTLLLTHKTVYNIAEECDPVIRFDDNMCYSTPDMYQDWDHNVCGKIVKITSLKSPDDIKTPDTILVFDEYKDEYLPYVRKCRGFVSLKDKSTNINLMDLVRCYHISCIMDIKDVNLYNAICSLDGKDVTFDTVGQSIYLGIKPIEKYTHLTDFKSFTFSHNFARVFRKYAKEYLFKKDMVATFGWDNIHEDIQQKYDISNCVFTATNGQKVFNLPIHIEEDALNLFSVDLNGKLITDCVISAEKITLGDNVEVNEGDVIRLLRPADVGFYTSVLFNDYVMSRDDERAYIVDKRLIEIDIPDNILPNTIRCVSYIGELKNKIDYIVDVENKKITFNLKPKRDEYIQVYGGEKNSLNGSRNDNS